MYNYETSKAYQLSRQIKNMDYAMKAYLSRPDNVPQPDYLRLITQVRNHKPEAISANAQFDSNNLQEMMNTYIMIWRNMFKTYGKELYPDGYFPDNNRQYN